MPTPEEVAATLSDIALRLATGPAPRADEMAANGLQERVAGREYEGASPYPEFSRLAFRFDHAAHRRRPSVSLTLTLGPATPLTPAALERVMGPCRPVPPAASAPQTPQLLFDNGISEDGAVLAFATLDADGRVGAVRLRRDDWPDETALNVKGLACLLAEPTATAALVALEMGIEDLAGASASTFPGLGEYAAPNDALRGTGYARAVLSVGDAGPGVPPRPVSVRLSVSAERRLLLTDLREILGEWGPAAAPPVGGWPAGVVTMSCDLPPRPGEMPVVLLAAVAGASAALDAPVTDLWIGRPSQSPPG